MQETSVGLEVIGFVFRAAIITLLIYIAGWVVVAVLAIWIVVHLIVTLGKVGDAPHPLPNWYAVAAAVLGAVTVLAHLLGLTGIAGLWLLIPATGAVVLGIRSLGQESPARGTVFIAKVAMVAAVLAAAISLFTAWIDRPLAITDENFEPSGDAITIEQVWERVGCEPGSTRVIDQAEGIDSRSSLADRVGECVVDSDSEALTYFFEFESPHAAEYVLDEGQLVAENDLHQDLTLFVDGSVLLLTADAGSSLDIQNADYEAFRLD